MLRLTVPVLGALLLLSAAGSGCDVNPFDQAQVPIVSVEVVTGEAPVISWTPAGASQMRVYQGTEAGDGFTPEVTWELQLGRGVSENGLQSPIEYGVVPDEGEAPFEAEALVVGEPYTVWIYRHDPNGSGTGFSNTSNNYTGTATFIR